MSQLTLMTWTNIHINSSRFRVDTCNCLTCLFLQPLTLAPLFFILAFQFDVCTFFLPATYSLTLPLTRSKRNENTSQTRKMRREEKRERRMHAVTDPITCQGTFALTFLHIPKIKWFYSNIYIYFSSLNSFHFTLKSNFLTLHLLFSLNCLITYIET